MYQVLYREKYIDGSYSPYHVLSDSDNPHFLVEGAKYFKELFPTREVIIVCIDGWYVIKEIK